MKKAAALYTLTRAWSKGLEGTSMSLLLDEAECVGLPKTRSKYILYARMSRP